MSEYSEFRVDSAKITSAKEEFTALGAKYNDVAKGVETSLKNISTTAWPDEGPAKAQFDDRAGIIKSKLEAINGTFVKNQKVFDAVETYATNFEQKMAAQISKMG